MVTVTATGFGDANIDNKVVTLKPLDSAGNAPAAGTAVSSWRCGSQTDNTSASIAKFLPGSCKG
jgi:type IV pilus assembly protein PilA